MAENQKVGDRNIVSLVLLMFYWWNGREPKGRGQEHRFACLAYVLLMKWLRTKRSVTGTSLRLSCLCFTDEMAENQKVGDRNTASLVLLMIYWWNGREPKGRCQEHRFACLAYVLLMKWLRTKRSVTGTPLRLSCLCFTDEMAENQKVGDRNTASLVLLMFYWWNGREPKGRWQEHRFACLAYDLLMKWQRTKRSVTEHHFACPACFTHEMNTVKSLAWKTSHLLWHFLFLNLSLHVSM